jgi:Fe-S-cluster containining protein
MQISNIISIDEVLVRQEIVNTHFACDIDKCKGACCTLDSEFGAPLKDEEVKIIQDLLPVVKKYLPEEHLEEIEQRGFYTIRSKEVMTQTVGRKACVFVFYENGTAKCAIERAFFNNETDFRKPLSCHLFPIRVSVFGDEVLRYEKFSECSPALENGLNKKITIAEFCKESLIRSYGKNWYSSLMKVIGK